MAIKLTDPFNSEGWIQAQKEPAVYETSTGKWYGKTVQLGEQLWMAENLKVTHYKDGTPIPCYTFDDAAWTADTGGACSAYIPNSNTEHGFDEIGWELQYGLLYNWHAVNNAAGLAPEGWHVPTDTEWTTLEGYILSGLSIIDDGSALADRKDLWNPADTTLIDSSDFGATGFNGLPAGYRNGVNGSYVNTSISSMLWSSSESISTDAWYRVLAYGNSAVYRNDTDKEFGFSVRCIKD